MSEERRTGYSELLETIKEFKQDIKEDIKDIKDDIKEIDKQVKDHITDELQYIDKKVHDHISINNKLFFNGYAPDKHVQDHHKLDEIVAKETANSNSIRGIIEEVLKMAAVAAATWLAVTTWNGVKAEVQPPFQHKQQVQQNDQ